jgi:hypothetical protein
VKRATSIAFRGFTTLLLVVSIATAYQNVFSDDLDLRARAGELARTHAGCADSAGTAPRPPAGDSGRSSSSACKVTSMRGSRGMIDEQIEYDIEAPKGGHIVVVCRRAYVVAGDYACTASKP